MKFVKCEAASHVVYRFELFKSPLADLVFDVPLAQHYDFTAARRKTIQITCKYY